MKKTLLTTFILMTFCSNFAMATDPVLMLGSQSFSTELKRATLSKNDLKNQYVIAMDKFRQSNVRSSYNDFKLIINNVRPNDYLYMQIML